MFYSACISALFRNLSLADALVKVREAGLSAYEFWGWWDYDPTELRRAHRESGLRLTAMCTRMLPLTDPNAHDAFLAGLEESISVAADLDCRMLIAQVGPELRGLTRKQQRRCVIEGLKKSVPILEHNGITLVFEPLNALIDHPGYFLTRSDEAFALARAVDSAYVKVLFDVYHQQVTEGNLILNLTQNIGMIGHIHIAGHPGRHEPLNNCEIHYPALLSALRNAAYNGAVGLEYIPTKDPVAEIKALSTAIPL